ncbi:MAG: HNH endonuclease [Bacillota bacterium]
MTDTSPSKTTSPPLIKTTPSFTTARKREHIKITLRRKLLQKASHCCEFVDSKTNARCQSHYQLQIDHRIPRARGGSNTESNLRVLCRTHNLLAAKQWGL